MIRRIAAWLVANGVDELVLNLHHRPETLTAVLGDGRDLGARVRYSWELPRILGSAGGPRLARADCRRRHVSHRQRRHADRRRSRAARRRARGVRRARHAGAGPQPRVPALRRRAARRGGRVTGFVRRGPSAEGSYHFIGVQIVDGRVFDGVDAGHSGGSIGGVYDALIASAARRRPRPGVRCVVLRRRHAHRLLAHVAGVRSRRGKAELEHWCRARIDASARVTQSILWDDVEVGAGAQLDQCIVTDGVTVPAGASHRRAILVRGEDDELRISSAEP